MQHPHPDQQHIAELEGLSADELAIAKAVMRQRSLAEAQQCNSTQRSLEDMAKGNYPRGLSMPYGRVPRGKAD